MEILQSEDQPISVYDVTNKKVIGIFLTATLARKYVFADDHYMKSRKSKTRYAITMKKRIDDSTLGFPVAMRIANGEQRLILGDNAWIVFDPYTQPRDTYMRGFDDTKESLQKDTDEKRSIYMIERNRIKNSE